MDNPSPNHSSPETLSSVVPAPKAPKAKFLAILIILLVLIASAGAVYYFIPK